MMTQPSGLKQNSLNFIQLKTDTQRNGYKTARPHRGPTSAAWRLPGRTRGPKAVGRVPWGPRHHPGKGRAASASPPRPRAPGTRAPPETCLRVARAGLAPRHVSRSHSPGVSRGASCSSDGEQRLPRSRGPGSLPRRRRWVPFLSPRAAPRSSSPGTSALSPLPPLPGLSWGGDSQDGSGRLGLRPSVPGPWAEGLERGQLPQG